MRWILCDERLPKEGQMVLTTIRGHDVIIPKEGETIEEAIERIWNDVCYVSVGFIGEDGWYGADGYPQIVYPIAWMPLPKPYKAEQTEPQTCETCKHDDEPWYSDACDGCCKAHSSYEPQTEMKYEWSAPQINRPKDGEPISTCVTYPARFFAEDEQTDCPWK